MKSRLPQASQYLQVAAIAVLVGFAAVPANAATAVETKTATPAKPNFIVILVDDLGFSDVGIYGSKDIPTPHIDSLAKNGTRFVNGYATCPVCTPSRAALLTGRYHERTGLEWVIAPDPQTNVTKYGLDTREKTAADLLRKQGYATGAIGKWHLGDQPQYVPTRRGFDSFYGYLQWGHFYLNPTPKELDRPTDFWLNTIKVKGGEQAYRYVAGISNAPIYRNEKVAGFEGYLTDALHQEAIHFIEKNKDRPFFLYLAEAGQHVPVQATRKYLDRFPTLTNFNLRKTYAAALSAIDDGVGNILAKLKELGLDRNTAIVFTSDNGGPSFWRPRPEILETVKAGSDFIPAAHKGTTPDYQLVSRQFQVLVGANGSDNEPLAFGKGVLYEGGIHVPYIVYWPGVAAAGKVSDAIVSHLDIVPTLVAAAGGRLPTDREYDGVDLRPRLQGHEAKAAPATDRPLFWRVWNNRAVRNGHWKLVWSGDAAPHLYDLGKDTGEQVDLAATHPEIVRKLQSQWTEWNKKNAPPAFQPFLKLPTPAESASQ
jgi:arylsulfatase A-like enzyme